MVFGGAHPGKAFDGVVGDEVDFGADCFGAFGEDAGLFEVVVDVLDEDILEGEVLLLTRVPVAKGFEEFVYAPALVDGHDLGADFVGGSVEGDGEPDLAWVVGEFFDLRNEAGGGDGEVAGTDVKAFGGGDEFDCFEQIGEVGEGFAHTHEDEVVDAGSGHFFSKEDLGGDFAGSEVAGEAEQSRGAEFAGKGAADLGGDAEGEAVRLLAVEGGGGGDEHAFDEAAVGELEEEFASGVLRALGADEFG